MALFNPPLYKPSNKKCPNCGHPHGWNCYWHSGLWAGRMALLQVSVCLDSRLPTGGRLLGTGNRCSTRLVCNTGAYGPLVASTDNQSIYAFRYS
jgi:hypothetical protein